MKYIALAMAVTLSGCQMVPGTKQNAVERGKAQAASMLREPASAKFKDVYLSSFANEFDGKSYRAVCGQIAGKNAFGGYAPFVSFIANPDGPEVFIQAEYEANEVDKAYVDSAPKFSGAFEDMCPTTR